MSVNMKNFLSCLNEHYASAGNSFESPEPIGLSLYRYFVEKIDADREGM